MREQNLVNLIAPSSYTSFVNVKDFIKDQVLKEHKIQFNTPEEFIYYMTHKVNNKLHNNGRIYMKIDDNGNLFANSVSPYSEQFLLNIEEKIKPLVTALHNKRYLTYSSCEGHGLSYRRYVGIAFADESERTYVENFIEKQKIFGVKTKIYDSVINQHVSVGKNSPQYNEKFNNQLNPVSPEEEANTFNIQFHRNYERYYFLEIIILEEIPYDKSFWKRPIYFTLLKFLKKYHWDKKTQKITNAINSKEFKKYRY